MYVSTHWCVETVDAIDTVDVVGAAGLAWPLRPLLITGATRQFCSIIRAPLPRLAIAASHNFFQAPAMRLTRNEDGRQKFPAAQVTTPASAW